MASQTTSARPPATPGRLEACGTSPQTPSRPCRRPDGGTSSGWRLSIALALNNSPLRYRLVYATLVVYSWGSYFTNIVTARAFRVRRVFFCRKVEGEPIMGYGDEDREGLPERFFYAYDREGNVLGSFGSQWEADDAERQHAMNQQMRNLGGGASGGGSGSGGGVSAGCIGCSLLGAVVLLVVCGVFVAPKVLSALTAPKGITVQATQGWQDTNYSVKAGDSVTITYLSGTWTVTNGVSASTDANGKPPNPPAYLYCSCGEPLPGVSTQALIGKVGNGQPFFVGDSKTFTAANAGHIFLRINDSDKGLGDNSGSIQVQITVNTPSTPTPKPAKAFGH